MARSRSTASSTAVGQPMSADTDLTVRVSRVKAIATHCADATCRARLILPAAGRNPAFMVIANRYRADGTWVDMLAWHEDCYKTSGAVDTYGPIGRDARAEIAERRNVATRRANAQRRS